MTNHNHDHDFDGEDDGFGVAKYGEAAWTYRRLKTPKEGSDRFIARIIPPYGNGRRQGIWAHYTKLEYGYEVPDARDPTKMRKRPFGCVEQQNRGGMITVECPKCRERDEVQKKLDNKMAKLKADGMSDEEAKDLTADLRDWLRVNNIDRKWRIAVMTQEEKLCILSISHRTKKKLDAEIAKLRREGTDPIDPNAGVWFEFERTGFGTETNDDISVVMTTEMVGNRKMQAILPAPISRDMRATIIETMPSLDESYLRLPFKAVQELVNSSGDPEEVAEIFNRYAKPEAGEDGAAEAASAVKSEVKAMLGAQKAETKAKPATSPAKTEVKSEVKSESKAETKAGAETVEQRLARLEALEKELAAVKLESKASATPSKPVPVTTTSKASGKAPDEVLPPNPDEMDVEQFLSMYSDPSKDT